MTSTALTLDRPPAAARSRWWALPVLLAGTVMIVLDFFIVNVALPTIRSGLHAGPAALEWIVAGYGLALASLLVVAGRLADRFGRRRVLCAGLLMFGAASALCGVAPDPAVLVAARVLQGGAAALISPTVLSLIGVLYQGPDRVRAISAYGMAMGVAAAGGQLLGGLLVQADIAGTGWRAIFLINVPVAVLAAAAGRLVPESRAEQAPGLDGPGVALVTGGLVALVLPLVQGQATGWPVWTWLSMGGAPALLVAFAVRESRLERAGGTPLLAPSLFRVRELSAGLVTQLAFWSGQAALFLVLALYLQEGRGYRPLAAGLVFTVLAAAYLAASLRAPALTIDHGRSVVLAGSLALAAGDASLALAVGLGGAHCPLWSLFPGLLAAGAGMGLCITPLTTVVLAHVETEQAGVLSGALSTMQQVGNALGVAVTGVIFFGAARHGIGRAFALSTAELAALLVGVAALTRLLPARRAAA